MGVVSSAATSPRSGYRALLRRPGYPRFVLTVSLSRLAASMFITTGVLLVLSRTHSAALAGVTEAAGTMAGALSAPVLGAWLDVAPRRRVLIVFDQLLSASALIGLVLLAGRAPNWTLPVAAMVLSFTRPFTTGGFFSTMSEVAGVELLDQASSVEATSLNLSFVFGPALGGALAATIGPGGAVYVQAALTVLVAGLIAVNPAFELRSGERPERVGRAVRQGMRAIRHSLVLRRAGLASMLAVFGWGLMTIGFPLYAARLLHAGANAGGYLWGALALGSIIGTFALASTPSLRRAGLSYLALALSGLLWPLAASLSAGILLVGFTGVLEGPAFSGTIALRQRHAPAAVRSAVMNTLDGLMSLAGAAGAVLAGALADPVALVIIFAATNLLAATSAIWPATRRRRSPTQPDG